MTTYPVLPIIMPSDLEGQKNGEISAALLRNIKAPNGKLHSLAATAWNALQLAAYFDGIELKHVGAYRPLCDGFATSQALLYGFTWAVADPKNPNFEPWHLQYVTGDTWTPAVLEALKVFPALEA
jgi:LAS superfamily LD-carboxypeptidase LdcB